QAALYQIGIDSPMVQKNWSEAEKLQKKQDLLMKRPEQIEKTEFKPKKRHEKKMTTTETTAKTHEQAKKNNENRDIRAKKHYIQRLDSDILKQ
ncbi:hypothetical protein EU74_14880, partial [Staphylococcus aureus]